MYHENETSYTVSMFVVKHVWIMKPLKVVKLRFFYEGENTVFYTFSSKWFKIFYLYSQATACFQNTIWPTLKLKRINKIVTKTFPGDFSNISEDFKYLIENRTVTNICFVFYLPRFFPAFRLSTHTVPTWSQLNLASHSLIRTTNFFWQVKNCKDCYIIMLTFHVLFKAKTSRLSIFTLR